MARAFEDLTGRRFGRLTVTEFAHKNAHGTRCWHCLCDCGNKRIVQGGTLKSGIQVSCGCKKNDDLRARETSHGMSHHRAYRPWKYMIDRCRPTAQCRKHYADRGISVCERWTAFENFYEDMGECPKGMTLERIDNNKGYSKENCRWATMHDQCRNMRSNIWVEIDGRTQILVDWAREFGIKDSTVYNRVARGATPLEALQRGNINL